MTAQRSDDLLILLQDAGLDFVVVGGVAAIAHGSARSTKDLDIVVKFDEENLKILLDALRPHRPKHLSRPDLGLVSQSALELSSHRILLLITDLGRLDVLREVAPIGGLQSLATEDMELVEGRVFPVISLDQLILIKSTLTRLKDRDVETELRTIRSLRNGIEDESAPNS